MRGRKKIPTEIKELRGTARADRKTPAQMKPDPFQNIPMPPEHLGEIAQAEWINIVSNYAKLNMLSSLDASMIASYCTLIEQYIEANTELKAQSKIVQVFNADGSVKGTTANPLIKIANEALDRALKIAVELGLTPASRTKISVSIINKPDFEQADEFDI
jgi:P27 family predicted phage terminase small subunit